MKRAHEVMAAVAFVLALSGCSTRVIGGAGGSDPGEQTDQGDQGSTSGDEAPNAVAMRFSQWTPPVSDPGDLFDVGQLGGVSDPSSLVLFFSNRAQSCPQPFVALDTTDCADLWQIILVIPSALAQPGVIDLQDQSIIEYRSVWEANCSGGGSGNGPGIVPGTLTISSIDATSVVAQLDLDPSTGWEGESGNYTAAFCP